MNLITSLHPKVVEAVNKLITEAKARGLNVGMRSGIRTAEEQDDLYALGRTKINPDGIKPNRPMGRIVTKARAFESWHNYGIAVDVVFRTDKGWTWDDVPDEKWDELGNVGKLFGFEWGGDWSSWPDLPHFQIRGKLPNLRECKRILFEKGIDELWKLV